MPRFYDCFPFFNELDLLEIRFEELDPVVDGFVLVESTLDFQLKKKPLYFLENRKRFERWNDKITHVVVNELAPVERGRAAYFGEESNEHNDQVWSQERFQKNQILLGLELAGARDEDLCLIADADEIPARSTVNLLRNGNAYSLLARGPVFLPIRTHFFFLDLVCDGPVVFRLVASTIANAKKFTPNGLRVECKEDPARTEVINPAFCGWHFSHFGTPEEIVAQRAAKAESNLMLPEFLDAAKMAERMARCSDPLDRPFAMRRIPLGDDYPEAVKANPVKYLRFFRACCQYF